MSKHDLYSFIKIGFRMLGMISLFSFLAFHLQLDLQSKEILFLIAGITVGAEVFGIVEEL